MLQDTLDSNGHAPHMAKPRLVYISNATETSSFYTKAELTALSSFCREIGMLLFMDGARLGAALAAPGNELTLADIAALTDMSWIGFTKVGALLDEAIIIPNKPLADDFEFEFEFHIKERGALLAKGQVLGVQFKELFGAGLFYSLPRHTADMAERLAKGLLKAGFAITDAPETNVIFPILSNTVIERLQQEFAFYVWAKHDANHSVIRLVTSWATDPKQVAAFISSAAEG
jgi:threonine aldolase